MIYAQTRIHSREWDENNSLELGDTNGSVNPHQNPGTSVNCKKNDCNSVDYDLPVDQKVEIKESEKIKKYLDRAEN